MENGTTEAKDRQISIPEYLIGWAKAVEQSARHARYDGNHDQAEALAARFMFISEAAQQWQSAVRRGYVA